VSEPTKSVSHELQPRWICQVVRGGYHNGSWCSPADPHGGWDCGWYFSYTPKAVGPDDRLVIEVTRT
jgi:hypothetical protein